MTAAIDTDSWSEWPAPAKLNLFLRITGRRADGFHNVQTVFQLLDWGDTIRLRVRTDRAIIRNSGNDAVPEAADLAVRAAQALQQAGGGKHGCEIAIVKRIPLGGGFGGGSSDAATVLVALNQLWKAGLSTDQLATLGRTLGADVPVFVHGHNAWAEGIGDELQPLVLPPAWYVIADPGIHVPTATLFLAPDLTRDAQPVTIRDLLVGAAPGSNLGNAFEPLLRRREPAIAAALDALSMVGSARVTGSGGGCFVAFADHGSAQAALESLPPGVNAWIAQGAPHSPLLDRLHKIENIKP